MNTGKSIRVLLVDDSAIFRERIAALIAAVPGVEIVGQAVDALAGLAFSRALRPDVVFLDIGLPGPSGIELLKAIKLQKKGPIVIMLTNHSSPQMREKCFELGAEFYFYKPDEFEMAIDVCRRLADTKGKMTHNEKPSEDQS